MYGKTVENITNRIDVTVVNKKEAYLKWTSKPSNMWQKMLENYLVANRKAKVTLNLNKLAYIGKCILNLTRVLMYEFHYDYIKRKYGNKFRLLSFSTDSLMSEIKIEDVYEDFSGDKEMLDFSIFFSAKSKYYDEPNILMVGKMKIETGSIAIKESVELKSKMYSFLVDDSSEHKK